jgi:MYXO-CTERM domain-containing protein
MSRHEPGRLSLLVFMVAFFGWSSPAAAVPPTPSGGHPRLLMGSARLAAYQANASAKNTAAQSLVARCQETIDQPTYYTGRGGADGDNWPGAAVACAFAYLATQNGSFLTQAIKYWNAALADDQTLGDGKGCVAGVDTDWKTWAAGGSGSAPPVILTVTHDTGYPMRWYGPYLALTYDWLHDAPGVDEALRAHTRTCLTNWVDYYTQKGYHHDEPGANYNAGYVIGKTLTAIAFGGENGSDGDRLWAEAVNEVFGTLLIADGLAGAQDPVGQPAGVLVGGDWGEGWQYGPLSVLEYAAAARAMEEAGAPLPEMDAWTNSLIVRFVHATVPGGDGMFNSNGDLDAEEIYPSPSVNQLDAVLLGPSSDQAAAWATFEKQGRGARGSLVWNALAEARTVTAADYRAQTPAAPLWYLARGTRTVFGRTAWDASAYWGVFSSPPQVVSDHHHFCAGNFVFSRGADHLIVDPSNYGEPGTLATNAPSVDSDRVTGDYAPSQTPWSQAELLWARGTASGVYAARGDYAKAFNFSSNPSDITYARRDFVMLPEGEVVIIDRAATKDASHKLYVNFHVNTGGGLQLGGGAASGRVGNSQVAIHPVLLPGGSPAITQPPVNNDYNYPCGNCKEGRFAVDNYGVEIPGPWAAAIHVIDGFGAGETLPAVGSMGDDNYDPAPKQNGAVIGAAIYRSSKQSYVLASSAANGAAGASLTYSVPGGGAGRHVVFDAPEQSDGQSTVTATPAGDRCAITIVAGPGTAGRPLMFSVGTAAGGCAVSEDTDIPPGVEPPGGGVMPTGASGGGGGAGGSIGGGGSTGGSSGGCGCALGRGSGASGAGLLVLGLLLLGRRRRARAPSGIPRPPVAAKNATPSLSGVPGPQR